MSQADFAGSPYFVYLSSIPFKFYSILMVAFSIVSIFIPFKFSFFNLAEPAYKMREQEGDHDSHEAHEECKFSERVPPRIGNLIIPLIFLLTMIVYLFWWTGQAKGVSSFWNALLNADYEKSILVSSLATLVVTTMLYLAQKIPMKELQSHFLRVGLKGCRQLSFSCWPGQFPVSLRISDSVLLSSKSWNQPFCRPSLSPWSFSLSVRWHPTLWVRPGEHGR